MPDRNSSLNAFGLQLPGGRADSGNDDHDKSQSTTQKGGGTSKEQGTSSSAGKGNETANKSKPDRDDDHDGKNDPRNDGKPNDEHDDDDGNDNTQTNNNDIDNKVDVDVTVNVADPAPTSEAPAGYVDIGDVSGTVGDILYTASGDINYDPGIDVSFNNLLNGALTGSNSAAYVSNQVANMSDDDTLDECDRPEQRRVFAGPGCRWRPRQGR